MSECAFALSSDTNASVRFLQLWQWTVPLPGLAVTDLTRIDGGALGFARTDQLPLQSEVFEVSRRGTGRSSRSDIGMATQNFVELPDAGLWLAGLLEWQPFPISQQRLTWGAVDAGSTGRFRPDLALLRFDVNTFTPVEAQVWDLPESSSTKSAVGPGPLLVGSEGRLLAASSFGTSPDGGSAPFFGVASLDAQLQPVVLDEFPSLEPVDVALTSAGVTALGLSAANLGSSAQCMVTEPQLPMLARIGGTVCSTVAFGARLDAGSYSGTSLLMRGGGDPTWASVSQQDLPLAGPGSSIPTGFGHVHRHDENLNPRWLSTLSPVLDGGEPAGLVPMGVVEWRGRILAFFVGTSVPGNVIGYETESGLRVGCPSGARSWLLMTAHEPLTGEVTWGHCTLADPDGGVSLVRADLRRRPVLGFNQQPRPIVIDDGVLIPGWVSPGAAQPAVWFGDELITFTTPSSFVTCLTPP